MHNFDFGGEIVLDTDLGGSSSMPLMGKKKALDFLYIHRIIDGFGNGSLPMEKNPVLREILLDASEIVSRLNGFYYWHEPPKLLVTAQEESTGIQGFISGYMEDGIYHSGYRIGSTERSGLKVSLISEIMPQYTKIIESFVKGRIHWGDGANKEMKFGDKLIKPMVVSGRCFEYGK